MLKVLFASTLLTLGMTGMVQAAGDAAAGAGKSAVCTACHGADGIGLVPIYPNLKGQQVAYLESSLKAYREGQRTGGNAAIMTPMAKNLSDEDIADLAAYYGAMK
ncbi:c-type cytochrome [Halopseudomonas pelagia]|uniref:c-type cytochrome n=1 Tax=Halopseudomonas pelagia TaxID=553151 RepID=UPI00039F964F|nr:cytochrome c [Halopseudomonas pelagia]